MNLSISTYIPNLRPKIDMPDKEILKVLGEEGIRQIVSKHYDLLVESEIRHLFPKNEETLAKAKQHAADFFIQIMGGHHYYKENRGAPMMTKRHQPFKITPEARIIWLECYQKILKELELPNDLLNSYWKYLDQFSLWMVNSVDEKKYENFKINL